MHVHVLSMAVSVFLVCVATQVASTQDKAAAKKTEPEFSVHEWGVFTVPRGAEWAKQDMLLEWQSFPKFFHGAMPARAVKETGQGFVTKPVLFFHCKEELNVDLIVRFADGQPLIWWPPTAFPAWPTPEIKSHLPMEWKDVDEKSLLLFETRLNGKGDIEPVPDDHWVNHLRRVESSTVSVVAHDRLHFGGDLVRRFAESFVYYDGLFKPPASPTVTRDGAGLQIISDSDHEWLDVLVVDRKHSDGAVSIARIAKIEKGKRTTKAELQSVTPAELDEWILEFKKSIVAAGLNEDEAQSLIDVWSVGLFQQSGLTMMYRLPQATYDDWIPLHFRPAPKELKRIGLVVHKHLEPELAESVGRLIKELGDSEYEVRQNAEHQLREIGGAAIFYVRQATKSKNVETAARAGKLLEKLNNQELLDEIMAGFDKPKSQKQLQIEAVEKTIKEMLEEMENDSKDSEPSGRSDK